MTARATDNANATSQSLPVDIIVGGPPQPKLIAINFKDNPATDINETVTGGYYWNSVASHTFNKGALRTLDNSEITDISISTGSNSFGFANNTRGSNQAVESNGFVFPASVSVSYVADNYDSGRNGHATIRLFSSSPYTYSFTILSSYAHTNPGDNTFVTDFNVGGTYSTSTRRFTGGETLTLDSSFGADNWSAGTLSGFAAIAVDGGYELLLTAGQRIGGAYINAMIVEAVPSYTNHPPVADAGSSQTVTDPNNDGFAAVALDGTGSFDPDEGDSIFSYHWFMDDTEIATGPSPTVILPVGAHTVTLMVKENFFVESTATVSITVLPSPGVAPIAVATSSSPGQDMDNDGFGYVSLDGTASYDPDAGDTIVSYQWKRGETLLAQGAQVDVNLAVGTHTITLVVTDNWNKSGSVDIQVIVLASPGVPPVAIPPADFAIENSEDKGTMPVLLDGSASFDPDGDAIVLYQWKIGNSVIATGAQVAPILPVGTHTITLVVTDAWNMQGSADVVVTVYRPALVAPIANAGPDQTLRDNNDSGSEAVQLDGSASYDPLGPIGIIEYRWLLNDVEIATGVRPMVTLPVGQHDITLVVRDDDDLEGTDSVVITVLPALGGERLMIGLAFNNTATNDQSAADGIFWNGVGASTSGPIALRDSQGNLTDISLELTNPFEFVGHGRGVNQRLEIEGVSIPAGVMANYVATNFDNSRDGEAALQLISTRNYRYRFIVISSVNHNNPPDGRFVGQINYGGVYGGVFNRTFVGGESITVDGGKGDQNWDYARSDGWMPVFCFRSYSLNVGFGSASSANSGGVVINAIILELVDMTGIEDPTQPESGFAGWIARQEFNLHGAERELLADPDQDGIVNLMEYALRLNPSVPGNLSEIVYLHMQDDQYRFRFRFNDDATDLHYAVEYSHNLAEGSWQIVPQQKILTVLNQDGFTVFEATIPVSMPEPVFVRLRVQVNE
ncbi:MAG: hypothetical protein LR015_05375 [Verrucomicrobia bacterium]|nr:hypothetical protein [Verrucomicrobiota bacterium]